MLFHWFSSFISFLRVFLFSRFHSSIDWCLHFFFAAAARRAFFILAAQQRQVAAWCLRRFIWRFSLFFIYKHICLPLLLPALSFRFFISSFIFSPAMALPSSARLMLPILLSSPDTPYGVSAGVVVIFMPSFRRFQESASSASLALFFAFHFVFHIAAIFAFHFSSQRRRRLLRRAFLRILIFFRYFLRLFSFSFFDFPLPDWYISSSFHSYDYIFSLFLLRFHIYVHLMLADTFLSYIFDISIFFFHHYIIFHFLYIFFLLLRFSYYFLSYFSSSLYWYTYYIYYFRSSYYYSFLSYHYFIDIHFSFALSWFSYIFHFFIISHFRFAFVLFSSFSGIRAALSKGQCKQAVAEGTMKATARAQGAGLPRKAVAWPHRCDDATCQFSHQLPSRKRLLQSHWPLPVAYKYNAR